MCPACWSTIALFVAGAGSAGGLTALVVKKSRGAQTHALESAAGTTTATSVEAGSPSLAAEMLAEMKEQKR